MLFFFALVCCAGLVSATGLLSDTRVAGNQHLTTSSSQPKQILSRNRWQPVVIDALKVLHRETCTGCPFCKQPLNSVSKKSKYAPLFKVLDFFNDRAISVPIYLQAAFGTVETGLEFNDVNGVVSAALLPSVSSHLRFTLGQELQLLDNSTDAIEELRQVRILGAGFPLFTGCSKSIARLSRTATRATLQMLKIKAESIAATWVDKERLDGISKFVAQVALPLKTKTKLYHRVLEHYIAHCSDKQKHDFESVLRVTTSIETVKELKSDYIYQYVKLFAAIKTDSLEAESYITSDYTWFSEQIQSLLGHRSNKSDYVVALVLDELVNAARKARSMYYVYKRALFQIALLLIQSDVASELCMSTSNTAAPFAATEDLIKIITDKLKNTDNLTVAFEDHLQQFLEHKQILQVTISRLALLINKYSNQVQRICPSIVAMDTQSRTRRVRISSNFQYSTSGFNGQVSNFTIDPNDNTNTNIFAIPTTDQTHKQDSSNALQRTLTQVPNNDSAPTEPTAKSIDNDASNSIMLNGQASEPQATINSNPIVKPDTKPTPDSSASAGFKIDESYATDGSTETIYAARLQDDVSGTKQPAETLSKASTSPKRSAKKPKNVSQRVQHKPSEKNKLSRKSSSGCNESGHKQSSQDEAITADNLNAKSLTEFEQNKISNVLNPHETALGTALTNGIAHGSVISDIERRAPNSCQMHAETGTVNDNVTTEESTVPLTFSQTVFDDTRSLELNGTAGFPHQNAVSENSQTSEASSMLHNRVPVSLKGTLNKLMHDDPLATDESTNGGVSALSEEQYVHNSDLELNSAKIPIYSTLDHCIPTTTLGPQDANGAENQQRFTTTASTVESSNTTLASDSSVSLSTEDADSTSSTKSEKKRQRRKKIKAKQENERVPNGYYTQFYAPDLEEIARSIQPTQDPAPSIDSGSLTAAEEEIIAADIGKWMEDHKCRLEKNNGRFINITQTVHAIQEELESAALIFAKKLTQQLDRCKEVAMAVKGKQNLRRVNLNRITEYKYDDYKEAYDRVFELKDILPNWTQQNTLILTGHKNIQVMNVALKHLVECKCDSYENVLQTVATLMSAHAAEKQKAVEKAESELNAWHDREFHFSHYTEYNTFLRDTARTIYEGVQNKIYQLSFNSFQKYLLEFRTDILPHSSTFVDIFLSEYKLWYPDLNRKAMVAAKNFEHECYVSLSSVSGLRAMLRELISQVPSAPTEGAN